MTARNPQARLAADMAGFATDPLGHALYAYPWGRDGLEGSTGPRRWQREVLREIGDHLSNPATRFMPLRLATASGHGPGKSGLIGMVSKWALDTSPDTRIVVTANTENQLLTKTAPELAKWQNLSITRDWFRTSATSITSKAAGHDRSWRLDLIPWSAQTPEAFAGLHNKGKRILVIFDEASTIADRIWQVVEGALTDEDTELLWLVFGNPTRNTGAFRECFGRHRHRWSTRHLDSRDVEGTSKAYLDELVATYGEDSDIVKVRVRGLFPSASSMQFIGSELAAAARQRIIAQAAILPSDPVIFGLDHARFGDDKSVLAIRQGRDARSRPWRRWQGANSMEIAGDLAAEAQKYHPDAIFVDAGGPNAGGVIDRARQLIDENIPIFEISFGGIGREARWNGEIRVRTANKRAEMWTNMRAWLERGALPDEQQLEDDLIGPEYSYDKDNAILLEKKEHMKGPGRNLPSPDYGDALALTFAEEVAPRNVPGYLNPDNYGATKEYDRYAELNEAGSQPWAGHAWNDRPYDRYRDL
jgi:hypothetical protein